MAKQCIKCGGTWLSREYAFECEHDFGEQPEPRVYRCDLGGVERGHIAEGNTRLGAEVVGERHPTRDGAIAAWRALAAEVDAWPLYTVRASAERGVVIEIRAALDEADARAHGCVEFVALRSEGADVPRLVASLRGSLEKFAELDADDKLIEVTGCYVDQAAFERALGDAVVPAWMREPVGTATAVDGDTVTMRYGAPACEPTPAERGYALRRSDVRTLLAGMASPAEIARSQCREITPDIAEAERQFREALAAGDAFDRTLTPEDRATIQAAMLRRAPREVREALAKERARMAVALGAKVAREVEAGVRDDLADTLPPGAITYRFQGDL